MEDSGDASLSVIFAGSCFRRQKGCNQHSRNMNVYYCYSDISQKGRSQVAGRKSPVVGFSSRHTSVPDSYFTTPLDGRRPLA